MNLKDLRKLRRIVYSAIIKYRNIFYSFFLSFPKNVECNVCGWKGRHFLKKYSQCPSCGSYIRQRLLISVFTLIPDLSYNKIVDEKNILHFAPENGVMKIFKKKAHMYQTADFFRDDVDIQTDISNMANIKTERYDLVVACDVLEHVENDKKAVSEIYRILKPGGYAIITVPQKDGLEITFEDPNIISPQQRKKVFGQSDHVRIYGKDFDKLLDNSNFIVQKINSKCFSEEVIKKFVLFPPIISPNPFAANYRTLYFALKPSITSNKSGV